MNFNPVDLLPCRLVRSCMLCNTSLFWSNYCFCYHGSLVAWAVGNQHFCCANVTLCYLSCVTPKCYEGHLKSFEMGVVVTELVRYLQKTFFLLSCEMVFSYNKACFQERKNSWNCLFQHFLDENLYFSALEHLRLSPSPSFSPLGYWFANLFRILDFCSIGKGKILDPRRGRGEKGCSGRLSHPVARWQGFTHISEPKPCGMLPRPPSGPWVGLRHVAAAAAAYGREVTC